MALHDLAGSASGVIRLAVRLPICPPTIGRITAAAWRRRHMKPNGKVAVLVAAGMCRRRLFQARRVAEGEGGRTRRRRSLRRTSRVQARRRRRIRRGRGADDHHAGVVRRRRSGVSGEELQRCDEDLRAVHRRGDPRTRGDTTCSGSRRGRAAISRRARVRSRSALRIDPKHVKSLREPESRAHRAEALRRCDRDADARGRGRCGVDDVPRLMARAL